MWEESGSTKGGAVQVAFWKSRLGTGQQNNKGTTKGTGYFFGEARRAGELFAGGVSLRKASPHSLSPEGAKKTRDSHLFWRRAKAGDRHACPPKPRRRLVSSRGAGTRLSQSPFSPAPRFPLRSLRRYGYGASATLRLCGYLFCARRCAPGGAKFGWKIKNFFSRPHQRLKTHEQRQPTVLRAQNR